MTNREIPTHQEVADLLFNHQDKIPEGDYLKLMDYAQSRFRQPAPNSLISFGEYTQTEADTYTPNQHRRDRNDCIEGTEASWDEGDNDNLTDWYMATNHLTGRNGLAWRGVAINARDVIMKVCRLYRLLYREMRGRINGCYERIHNLSLKMEEMRQEIRDLRLTRSRLEEERDQAIQERDEARVALEENEECLQQMIDEYLPQANLS